MERVGSSLTLAAKFASYPTLLGIQFCLESSWSTTKAMFAVLLCVILMFVDALFIKQLLGKLN